MALPSWVRSEWFKNAVIVVATIAIAIQMARLEIVRRAKREFNEGEKYYRWYLEPDAKLKDLTAARDYRPGVVGKILGRKPMSENEFEHLKEEDIYKEAVVWWQTVGDFYYLPHSEWVDRAEERIWTTGQEHELRGRKKGTREGRDDLEHALMAYKAIVDSFRPMHGRRPGKYLEPAQGKVKELEAEGLRWP